MHATILRSSVWSEMLEAQMRASYFGELVNHYNNLDRALRVFTLAASSGAVAAALAEMHPAAKIGFPIAATVASFWLLFSNYSAMSRDAADLHAGWERTKAEYEHLFNHLDGPEAAAELRRITSAAEPLSKSGTKFPARRRRLIHWMDHAAAAAMARYSRTEAAR
ncbi:MAG: hypothetical protein ABI995_02690 [Acidobacteriota bacterium]